MKNKILYIGLGIFIFLIIIIIIISIIISSGGVNSYFKKTNKNYQTQNLNTELNKYRMSSIPEECRLPDYQNDIEAWKEHLSHHQQTLYCLDYYK